MAKRRGNNEGSIYFHKPSNRWTAQVTLQGRRLTKYFSTKKEGQEWAREINSQIDNGLTFSGARINIERFYSDWIRIIETTLRPKTWRHYSQIIRDHINPYIGKIKLKDLRPDQIQSLYTTKLEEGISPRTIGMMHAVLRKAFNDAIGWGLVGRNPINGVKKPKEQKKEMKYYNEKQVKILLSEVDETRYSALYYIAVTTGLRQGEILGLKWSDVDWENNRIQIQRQLQRVSGVGKKLTELKTDASRRSVAIGNIAIRKLIEHKEILKELRLFSGNHWKENNMIFPSTIGTPMEPRVLYSHFMRVIKKTGLPKIRFHDLRHTAATLMFKQGVHPKVVQERLGHASISQTLDTYSHVIPSMQDDIANNIDDLFHNVRIG